MAKLMHGGGGSSSVHRTLHTCATHMHGYAIEAERIWLDAIFGDHEV